MPDKSARRCGLPGPCRCGGSNQKETTIRDKYTLFAPFYDLFSGEYPVYHAGRVLGIDALAPTTGQQVLDIGCGTGLNFPLLQERVGSSGTIVGIDRSAEMLQQARRRAQAHGWQNVILLQADMVLLDPGTVAARIEESGGAEVSDAALATYSLSLMGDWEQAWTNMTRLLGTQARVGVVDLQEPEGWARWLSPLARLACAVGGSDITAAPWRAVEERCVDVVRASARGGHLQIRAGNLRHDR
ncbi:class I SAM-dependent methyltransferase [Pseudarthrobacter sp. AL07]|uniref:class I SAM-dependent methyltransferase n=1 Tax=unclassified Pseudarthrobacter TaxID=2647000 RepID=UPI00249A6EBE|nr:MULTISPECIES: class I SAM-dependent methyltransferase [unclassified Pseudarthrobacter]MDI3195874.1 class I SAM-dependent methyltransferase [Pseudarthrobacter sp. AL20]MDI3209584.1 class I SAM-dependent methyltransferase [Pseudarthrobacter sp. AL07]